MRQALSFSKRSLFVAADPSPSAKETFIDRSLSLRFGTTAMLVAGSIWEVPLFSFAWSLTR